MRKNYNFTRRKVYLPEYGRHIHEMVDSLLEIEDRHERTRQAKAVIAVMGNINPMLRDTEEFKHKLWDHLFIMSDFKLDVDSPYMQPSRQDLEIKPKKLPYPQSRVMFKHYGKHAQRFVRHIVEAQERANVGEEVLNVARFMRTKSYEFKHEHPNNDAIIRDFRIMAGSDVEIDLSQVTNMRSEYRQYQPSQRNAKGKKPYTQHSSHTQHSTHAQHTQHTQHSTHAQHTQHSHQQQHSSAYAQHSNQHSNQQHSYAQHANQQHSHAQRKVQKGGVKNGPRHNAYKKQEGSNTVK